MYRRSYARREAGADLERRAIGAGSADQDAVTEFLSNGLKYLRQYSIKLNRRHCERSEAIHLREIVCQQDKSPTPNRGLLLFDRIML
jgi:hypothetical protein